MYLAAIIKPKNSGKSLHDEFVFVRIRYELIEEIM